MYRTLLTSRIHRASVGGLMHEDWIDEAVPKPVFPDAANRIVDIRSASAGPQAGDLRMRPIDPGH